MQRTLFGSAGPRPPGPPTVLRLFEEQEDAKAAIIDAYQQGEKSVIIQEPTGGGKTIIAMAVIAELAQEMPGIVFLVHRDELAKQTADKAAMVVPNLSIGIVKAERNELYHDLIVASQPTIARENRMAMLDSSLHPRRLVVVDEAHHAVADTWVKTIERLKATFCFGMTATAYRADKRALSKIFGRVVHETPLILLIAKKRLKNPVGVVVKTAANLDEVHTRQGDFATDELDRAINTVDRNQLVVDAWARHREHKGQQFKRPIVFCNTIKHAEDIRDTFRSNGFPCDAVLGDTPISERERIYREFHEGRTYMTSVGVLTEGWDEPLADACIMARPTKSQGLWVQMVGRVLRQSMGMDYALVMDLVDNTRKHSLANWATLAGHEAEGKFDSDDLDEDLQLEEEVQTEFLDFCQQIAKSRKTKAIEVSLFGESKYLWGQAAGLWMTRAGSNTYLSILPDKTGEAFLPVQVTLPDSKFGKPSVRRLYEHPLEPGMARNLAEALVEESGLTYKKAAWRTQPATDGQMQYLKSLARQCGEKAPQTGKVSISMGEASQLIDRYRFTLAMRELGFAR